MMKYPRQVYETKL